MHLITDDHSLFHMHKLTPRRPYDHIQGIPGIQKAKEVIEKGWRVSNFPTVDVHSKIAWEESLSVHRSFSFRLQCWDFMESLLSAYDVTREKPYIEPCIQIALDWAKRYPNSSTKSVFAWYDMAVGIRVNRLAYLLDVSIRDLNLESEKLWVLKSSLLEHATELSLDSNIKFRHNHGFYQIFGQLAMAMRFPSFSQMSKATKQARKRFQRMLSTQFSEEGVHLEHSPDYGIMVYQTLRNMLESKLIKGREVTAFAKRIERNLGWFILPNGFLATFGDSTHRKMTNHVNLKWKTSWMRFVTSFGRAGRDSKKRIAAFNQSGYFIVNSSTRIKSGGKNEYSRRSYLAQMLGFHSRTHKHADHLSIIWYDRGQEILIDAGSYGYSGRTDLGSDLDKAGFWYSDPKRVFVESTHAHNAIEIDSLSHPRRGVKPFGSALDRWGESHNGIIYCESQIRLFRTIRYCRVLFFNPSHWLIVYDWLLDNLQLKHDYKQWFHLNPNIKVKKQDTQYTAELEEIESPLVIASLLGQPELTDVYFGSREPRLQGWWSPRHGELEPNPAIAFQVNKSAKANFVSIFCFSRFLHPDLGINHLSLDGRQGQLKWQADNGTNTLEFHRPKNGRMEVNYRENR